MKAPRPDQPRPAREPLQPMDYPDRPLGAFRGCLFAMPVGIAFWAGLLWIWWGLSHG